MGARASPAALAAQRQVICSLLSPVILCTALAERSANIFPELGQRVDHLYQLLTSLCLVHFPLYVHTQFHSYVCTTYSTNLASSAAVRIDKGPGFAPTSAFPLK